MMGEEIVKCELCGEPMPRGEEMFNYHGYSGPCPKPPLTARADKAAAIENVLKEIVQSARNGNEPGGRWMLVAGGLIDQAEEILKADG